MKDIYGLTNKEWYADNIEDLEYKEDAEEIIHIIKRLEAL